LGSSLEIKNVTWEHKQFISEVELEQYVEAKGPSIGLAKKLQET